MVQTNTKNNNGAKPTPAPGTNGKKPPTAIDMLYQELQKNQARTADLALQVQRLQKYNNLDAKELNVGKLKSETAVLKSVAALVETVEALTSVISDQQRSVDADGQAYWLSMQRREYRELQKRIGRIRFLQTCRIVPTGVQCDCGRSETPHMLLDIRNPQRDEIVESGRCPISLWISMSRLAHAEGRLGKFRAEHPLGDFVKKYRMRSGGSK